MNKKVLFLGDSNATEIMSCLFQKYTKHSEKWDIHDNWECWDPKLPGTRRYMYQKSHGVYNLIEGGIFEIYAESSRSAYNFSFSSKKYSHNLNDYDAFFVMLGQKDINYSISEFNSTPEIVVNRYFDSLVKDVDVTKLYVVGPLNPSKHLEPVKGVEDAYAYRIDLYKEFNQILKNKCEQSGIKFILLSDLVDTSESKMHPNHLKDVTDWSGVIDYVFKEMSGNED